MNNFKLILGDSLKYISNTAPRFDIFSPASEMVLGLFLLCFITLQSLV